MNEVSALALEHVAKRFGQVQALADATLVARAGTVHALLGENGAGKTTLMRVAFGMIRPDGGIVRLHGEPVELPSPAHAISRGIGMVHQHFSVIPAMTVAENVALGGHGRYRPSAAAERVHAIGAESGLELDPHSRVADLPVGALQRLEIVKALARGASLLILDEPTAVLAPSETDELLRVLRRFAERGGTVVMITHKLREVLAAADDVTVLRAGRTVWRGRAAEASEQSLADAMIGETGEIEPAPGRAEFGASPESVVARRAPAIIARDVVVEDRAGVRRVKGATFDVAGGEILGIAAVEGAGQHELLRALAGRVRSVAGTLTAPARVGFIPENREREALILDFPLYENVALRGAGLARGRMRWRAIVDRTTELLARYDVRAPGPAVRARTLSGGNQQKVVLARELDDSPPAIVAENPTRGLDIAATAAVHARLLMARDAGAAVVVYSSDLDEVLALADRVLVMYAGRVTVMPPEREAVGRAMLGLW